MAAAEKKTKHTSRELDRKNQCSHHHRRCRCRQHSHTHTHRVAVFVFPSPSTRAHLVRMACGAYQTKPSLIMTEVCMHIHCSRVCVRKAYGDFPSANVVTRITFRVGTAPVQPTVFCITRYGRARKSNHARDYQRKPEDASPGSPKTIATRSHGVSTAVRRPHAGVLQCVVPLAVCV